jgi:hypothetical protein
MTNQKKCKPNLSPLQLRQLQQIFLTVQKIQAPLTKIFAMTKNLLHLLRLPRPIKTGKDTSTGGRSSKAYDWSIQEIGKPGKGVKFVITIPMQ